MYLTPLEGIHFLADYSLNRAIAVFIWKTVYFKVKCSYQIGQCTDSVSHDGENVIERFPRLGQFEDSKQSKRSQNWQTTDAICQKFDQRQQNDDKVENVPAVLNQNKNG
jgi:uncharacterized protein (DUF2126 family)